MSRDAAVSPRPASPPLPPPSFSGRPTLSALATVLGITASRLLRGRRIWLFLLLFVAPTALLLLVRHNDAHYEAEEAERVILFVLFFHAVIPLAALLFAASLVQDDVEEQTLTYFLIRPIPRWMIYVVKAVGGALVASALASVFAALAMVAARWGEPGRDVDWLLQRAGIVAALVSLGVLAYVAIFGCLGLLTKRALSVGIFYILVFEVSLANIPFLLRYVTIIHHLRVLSIAWLGLNPADWAIDLAEAPSPSTSLEVLLGASAFFIALGAWIFSTREFRVKTPEGN